MRSAATQRTLDEYRRAREAEIARIRAAYPQGPRETMIAEFLAWENGEQGLSTRLERARSERFLGRKAPKMSADCNPHRATKCDTS